MYPTIDMKATGLHIRQIMDHRNITVKDIQKYLNLASVQSVYHWLNGRSMPTVDNLYALSALFGMTVDEILIGNRRDYRAVCGKSFYDRISAYYRSVWKLCALQN